MKTILIRHQLGPDGPVYDYPRTVEDRFFHVPARCPDCSSQPPQTFTPPPDFDAAVLLVHAPTCPNLVAALRRMEGER
jgi:hypothetical protein